MAFASLYVPNFMVQAVVRAEPELRERALALVEGDPPLWKVVAANQHALAAGIELGMGGSQARQFSSVELRSRSLELEKTAQAALLDVGWSVSPRVEDTAPDTIVLDLAGLTSLFESVKNLATVLIERAASIGLHPHVAVASKIETAIHAARGFPGITLIPPGEESERLNPLPVKEFFSSGDTFETLDRWGIRTFGELAALPLLPLSERLGQEGVRLHELARGAFCRALKLAQPETFFEEELALDFAVTELEALSFLLGRLLDQLCARLAARSLAAGAFCLRLELQDCDPEDVENLEIRRKASVSRIGAKTFEKMLRLPVPMRDSKTLLKLLRLQLQADPPHGSIVRVSLSAEQARPRAVQKGLFIPDAPDPEKLEVTIARLANLVGNANVGSPELVNTHRPGEFRMKPYVPEMEETSDASLRRSRSAIAFRTFRPELPANVDSTEGSPCRISFRRARGEVIAASGPWRTSGDWWEERGWQQDEWDMEIRFERHTDKLSAPENAGQNNGSREHTIYKSHDKRSSRQRVPDGIYRIYYDWTRRGWFVRGRYD